MEKFRAPSEFSPSDLQPPDLSFLVSLMWRLSPGKTSWDLFEGSQHGKQKKFLRIQDGINPTQDPIYETLVAKMVRSNLLPLKIEQTRFVGAGVG